MKNTFKYYPIYLIIFFINFSCAHDKVYKTEQFRRDLAKRLSIDLQGREISYNNDSLRKLLRVNYDIVLKEIAKNDKVARLFDQGNNLGREETIYVISLMLIADNSIKGFESAIDTIEIGRAKEMLREKQIANCLEYRDSIALVNLQQLNLDDKVTLSLPLHNDGRGLVAVYYACPSTYLDTLSEFLSIEGKVSDFTVKESDEFSHELAVTIADLSVQKFVMGTKKYSIGDEVWINLSLYGRLIEKY